MCTRYAAIRIVLSTFYAPNWHRFGSQIFTRTRRGIHMNGIHLPELSSKLEYLFTLTFLFTFGFVFARIPSSHRRGKKRVTRMVTIVVLAFAICWLPIQVRKCKCCICCRMLLNIYARVCVSFAADTGGQVFRQVRQHTAERHRTDHFAHVGVHELVHQSGAVRLSFGQLPEGVSQGKRAPKGWHIVGNKNKTTARYCWETAAAGNSCYSIGRGIV